MSKRIYIAGPMTGLPDLNFPAFHAAAAELRDKGFDVVNPAEINVDPASGWHVCMRADICELMTCNAIYLLFGWTKSRGAMLEKQIAEGLDMELIYQLFPHGEVVE